MTLCIAAVCDDGPENDPKIVLCADFQKQTEGIGECETEDKVGFVKHGWPALIAGTITRANDLLNVYAAHFSNAQQDINQYTLMDHLRAPAHLQKEKLVDEYLRQSYAFDRNYFYGDGAQHLPETFITKVAFDIERIKLDASLLICGFLDETNFADNSVSARPFLGLIDEYQSASSSQEYVRIETEFAAIGSGSYTALSTLYRRSQESTDSLSKTIYNIWEANRLSESVPGVGKEYVSIYVLHKDGKLDEFNQDGYKHLRKLYKKYGPKDITSNHESDLLVKSAFFEDVTATPSVRITSM